MLNLLNTVVSNNGTDYRNKSRFIAKNVEKNKFHDKLIAKCETRVDFCLETLVLF